MASRDRIFISYRREDAPADARGLCERLGRAFGAGNVFMDVDRLMAGERFERELDSALGKCDVLIAVIGSRWLALLDEYAQQARLRGNHGYVLTPSQNVSADGVIFDPVPKAGTDGETVAQLSGVRSIDAPFSPQVTQFPEHRPFAAMDGDLSTEWLSDRYLDPARHRLDVTFLRPRDVPYIDVYPYSDSRAVAQALVAFRNQSASNEPAVVSRLLIAPRRRVAPITSAPVMTAAPSSRARAKPRS